MVENSTITGAFICAVDKYPDRVAVKYWLNDQWNSVTYSDLKREAQAISAWLRQLGVRDGDAVILPSRRSPNLCAQLLGILWSGAHYVFIDSAYPLQRQKFICSEVGARVGIYEGEQPFPVDLPIKCYQIPSSLPESKHELTTQDPEQPAYVVFTSGSTGTPKGVVIPHRGVRRLVLDTDYIRFDCEQVFLQLSALTFDASTLELWGPLLNGGTCVIYPEDTTANPRLIGEVLEKCGVTTAWLTSSLYNTIIASHPACLQPLRQLLIGGEALSVQHVRTGLETLPDTRILNGYGPTENTTFTTVYPIPRDLSADTRRIPIGYSINGTYCEIFDETLQPVQAGEVGELVAFGQGLALRYLNQPELTAERFVELKCSDGEVRLGYRTGDLVQQQSDGCFDYIGRNDKQVKIDGHRIEPGEIEHFLNQLPQVTEARVVVRTGPQGQKRIAAYVVGITQDDRADIRAILAQTFPPFMVPHFILPMMELPKNQNGKLDEAKLPDPYASQTTVSNASREVARSWQQILGRAVDENENFLEAGGTSLEALQLAELLEKQFDMTLTATFAFEHTSIAAQARFFEQLTQETRQIHASASTGEQHDIAVIGMACRMPGADNLATFWNNLLEGKESISFFSEEELSPEVSLADRQNPNYVRAKGIINNCDQFDAGFFGVTPLEADIMDPQQRIMLQLAWHAMEDAGCVPGDTQFRTGVFVGTNWARYFQQYVLNNQEVKQKFGLFNASLGNESDFLSTRISYKLNLTGPSLNIFTACSTGLVAISQACASIERGECEMALAGGVSVSTPVNSGYIYQEGSMLSRDGHCRPFDIQASGTTFNDGAGMVLLKRLDLAERDGDPIYAVVKGYAVNNDGENKASYTAPSVAGQVAVYNQALSKAGVAPETIGLIETHGTATPLGDPIEVKSLAQSYASGSKAGQSKHCVLGSVKSNIGHTIHAAGMAGFIKSVKAVETGNIPATLFFTEPNPKLELDNTPFFVNDKLISWPEAQSIRRAAISSLGVGGTNAHVIVEQYIQPVKHDAQLAEPQDTKIPHPAYSILLSAKSKNSLDLLLDRYQGYFGNKPETDSVAQEAYASLKARKQFPYRTAVSGATAGEIVAALANPKNRQSGQVRPGSSKMGFMFSGQGSQRQMMGHWLYENSKPFRDQFDRGCDIVMERQGFDLRAVLFSDSNKQHIGLDPNQTKVAQPALFLFEYGLARYLEQCGCHPDFLIGHSIGEFTAAALAGVFSFEQAVTLVAARGSLMQSQPPGKMLAVKALQTQVENFLNESVCLSGVNAPDRLVLSGPEQAILNIADELATQNIASTVLHTSHAFHSHMMQPIVPEFEALVASMELQPPTIPIFSTATGQLLEADATQASYWAQQLRNPVRFADAVASARQYFTNERIAFVEVGPGVALTTLVECQNTEPKNTIVPASDNCGTDESAIQDISACLNKLWAEGFAIDWQAHFSPEVDRMNRVRLPGYAFEPDVHWLTALPSNQNFISIPAGANMPPQTVTQEVTMSKEEHRQNIELKLRNLMEEVTGFELNDVDANDHFSEAGLDSLLLTQVATAVDRAFSVGLTFRHLVEEYTTIGELSDFIADKVPMETKQVVEQIPSGQAAVSMPTPALQLPVTPAGGGVAMNDTVQQLIQQQLQIMQWQLQALGGAPINAAAVQPAATAPANAAVSRTAAKAEDDKAQSEKTKPRHTPGTRITREKVGVKLTNAQQKWIDGVLAQYQKKYAKSKAFTQKYRKHLADPRSVSGFNPEWKEIIFPIVTERSKGSKLWDIDGNELIDTSNGFGPIFFGHSPDFVTEAVKKQMDLGIETGPQSPLAGEVAELFCELTGNERCSFASTGSEAVIGAIRLARTITGRNKVVMFEGSYHGIFDEVINRPGKDYQALPAAPGIPREATSNMLVLPWGEQESLDVLKQLGPELAAVLVESVQSRKPEFHDKEYLQAIRDTTNQTNTAMILDEVVTGFRVGPGGIRKYFDIDADLATYGKVVGGGHPIGIIGGKAKYLDALDGGYWQYGDDSIPEVGVTFFAGTFVRHPVALAAAKAILQRIKAEGNALYEKLANTTTQMASEAKTFIKQMKCEAKFEEFASFFYVSVPANAHWGHLLFTIMTLEGIHIQQYRPNFLTTEHSPQDVAAILSAFKKSLAQLISHGLIEGDLVAANQFLSTKPKIPEGARLGKNALGEPAYFIEDPKNTGKYIEVGKP